MTEFKYVTYEQAKILNKFGFPQNIDEAIYLSGYFCTAEKYEEYDCGGPASFELAQEEQIACPTLEKVKEWLRREKRIYVNVTCMYINPDKGNPDRWKVEILWIDENEVHRISEPFSGVCFYDEALNIAIEEAIKMLSK